MMDSTAMVSTSSPPPPPSKDGATPTSNNSDEKLSSHAAAHTLNARSCVTCRRRKVKCDKQVPCSNCTKAHTQCIFPAPGRAPRRPRAGGKVVSEREAELLKRLRRLEGVVEELSGQVEVEAIKHSPSSDNSSMNREGDAAGDSNDKTNSVRVVGMDEGGTSKKVWLSRTFNLGTGPPKTMFNLEKGFGKLVVTEGKSRYMSSPFWETVTEEVEELREILHEEGLDSDSDAPIMPSDAVTGPDHQSFLFGYSSASVNLKALHPLPSQIPFYWQTFLENVQPLVKILHAPTMSKVIKDIQNNMDSLSESTEALMFSIYLATITSMTADEVRSNFAVEKDLLLVQYRFAVEQALSRASFLNTNEIVTVQAFVLFLVCVRRHDDTRFVWSMTGLVIRIAQSLGLHRDGTKFGLSPFDTEMRRRLWWQICTLDIRASEDHGADASIMDVSSDTELPLSINDADIDPNSQEPPTPRPGVSEMTFCLIRSEICKLSRRLQRNPLGEDNSQIMTLEQKEALVKETADYLEETYLRYCEDAGPLYWVAATVARLVMSKMNLIIYHPLTQRGQANSLPQEIKDRLFISSVEIIEYSRILESEASTKQWGWLFHTYVQWHAIAYILGELCIRPSSVLVDRGWRAVDVIFKEWAEAMAHSKKGMLWQPLRKLLVGARRKREENMRETKDPSNQVLGIAPEYMSPEPSTLQPMPCNNHRTLSQDRQAMTATAENTTLQNNALYNGVTGIPPQIIGMGMLAPDQINLQLEEQRRQFEAQQQIPWLLEDNALVDLDMNSAEGEVSWEGWDDLVRDFQMEVDNQAPGARAPAWGGIGNWW